MAAAVSCVAANSLSALADDNHQVDEDGLQAWSDSSGHGHHPNPGDRTIDFWSGQTTVGDTTYTYDIVGADPASGQASTIIVDVVPLNLTIAGRTFRGTDIVDQVLGSPVFAINDYSSTVAASTAMMGRGPGGPLSAENDGVQLLDATMRSQFNQVGTGYHLLLSPQVHKPVAITVPPSSHPTTLTSRGGVTVGDVDEDWFQDQVMSLTTSLHYLEPHRLAMFLTYDVMLYKDHVPTHCCVVGTHGFADTTAEGNGSEGRRALQTFIWSSWITAGFFSPTRQWAIRDINGLSHELSEWAANPFATDPPDPSLTNRTPGWRLAAAAPCEDLLEAGDPVAGVGFSVGSNTFSDPADPTRTAANPLGWADGTFHGQDTVFLPWFFRASPNTVSQPSQGSTNGRYTFLGNLNRVVSMDPPHNLVFASPSAGC
jgi:hypothetical protein